MKKSLSFIMILILGFNLYVSAQTLAPFRDVLDELYNYTDQDSIIPTLDRLIANPPENFNDQQVLLFLSRAYQYKGIYYFRIEEKNKARESFTRAFNLAKEAEEMGHNREVYIQLSSTGAYKSISDGVLSIISMTSELMKYMDLIFVYSPQDPEGILLMSQRMIFAPSAFGGDRKKAIEMLMLNIPVIESQEKIIQFETYASLAQCWGREKDKEKSERFARMALAIYPGNVEMQELLQRLN